MGRRGGSKRLACRLQAVGGKRFSLFVNYYLMLGGLAEIRDLGLKRLSSRE